MSLFRTASKVAVASSVHGRVQQRQRARWAAEDQGASAGVAAARPAAGSPSVGSAALTPVLDSIPDVERRIQLLQQLVELRDSGVLTDAELATQKVRVLG